jgi:large subunit ribosomal protein L7/L12
MSVTTILESIKKLTVVELSELVKSIETEFGVSAAAPMSVAAAPTGEIEEKQAEKSEYKVHMKDSGGQAIKVIKALRAAMAGLGLKEAQELVKGAPCTVVEAMPKKEAQELKAALEEAGATVELV